MVVTAPASPSSLAGPPAQGRSAARSAFDRRSVIRVAPENDVFRLLEHRHAGASCIRRTRSHRRDSHPGRRRFSGHTRSGRYSWARYYHPGLQRFISEDPIGFAGGGTNLYAYVANNPLSFVDPLGLEKQAADEPCRLDMPLTSGWRLPDYLSLNVNFPIPWLSARTDDWVGGTFQVALDREGRLYGGLGPQVGKGPCIIPKRLVQAGAAYLGSWAGSIAGAELGFVVGELIVPAGGGFPGAFVGWAVGGAAGSGAAALGAGFLYDAVVPGGGCTVPPASGSASRSKSSS